jgi:anaerobic ribonucleoside-triphosphate reductase activating protein
MSVHDVAEKLLATGLPVTILGGEPFDQPESVAELVGLLKGAGRHVIIYTGNVLEDLAIQARQNRAIQLVLARADVLVDGPYIAGLDHGRLAYRGSSNQRPIDLETWRETGEIVMLDWEATDEVVVLEDGTIVGPEDVIRELEVLFQTPSDEARHCGQAPTEQEVTA